jgi:hypothetical protein
LALTHFSLYLGSASGRAGGGEKNGEFLRLSGMGAAQSHLALDIGGMLLRFLPAT